MTESLREVFSEYGNVIDVVAKKSLKRKGQAFVVFDSVESAQNAIDEVNGFELFGKQMSCDFAKTRSDASVKREGTEEEFESHKRRRLAEKERKQAAEAAQKAQQAKRAAPAPLEEEVERKPKAARGAGLKGAGGVGGGVVPDEYLPPNKIIFLRGVPDQYGQDELTTIFGRFPGFREVRMVTTRKGIAFVEYENEDGAITAKEATSNMTLGDSVLKVTFQRQ